MSRGVKSSVQHSDECRLGTMEALEADSVSRRRMILEKNAPTRPATNTALTVLEPPAPPVTATHTVRGSSSSGAGGSQIPSGRSARGPRSPLMETGDDEDARHTRRQSSAVPPLEAAAPKQRGAKRVSFALSGDSCQDGRKTLSTKRTSENDAEEL